jgi:hypothetical protein
VAINTRPGIPIPDPTPGEFTAAGASVTLGSDGSLAIYYTTDGTTPTTSSTPFTGAISILTTTTLKAIGANQGGLSDVFTGTFSIQ